MLIASYLIFQSPYWHAAEYKEDKPAKLRNYRKHNKRLLGSCNYGLDKTSNTTPALLSPIFSLRNHRILKIFKYVSAFSQMLP